jgi:clathrin heavy chain
MDYVNRLTNFDAADIANISVGGELYEEAYQIYKKYDLHVDAVSVLLVNLGSLNRACEYADRVDQPSVWSRVAKSQLDHMMVKEAIDSYIHAQDPTNFNEVIMVARRADKYEDLVRYLQMARKKVREATIESELAFAFAKTGRISELEDLVSSPNIAQIQMIGDRCFDEGMYDAAKILFTSISNWSRLAVVLVKLHDPQGAVECARKANTIRVWRDVNTVCIANGEFRLAQVCGLNLIIHAEELEAVIKTYEKNGYFDHLIQLIENGLGLERAHMGMFTELAILFSKYRPERLIEHLRLFSQRINIPKVIRACEMAHLYQELVYLYTHYDEFDNAALTMMNHSAIAWEHATFKDVIVKVANLEIYYKALRFYFDEQPTLLNDLLLVLTPRVDHTRVVQMFQKLNQLPLIKSYLMSVQQSNNKAVNEAYNELLIEEEDYLALRESIDKFVNFDNVQLAQRLEKHELLEFRRIAAHLYKKNKRWKQSIALSKQDQLFKDAMETAAESKDSEVAEELLKFFIEQGKRDCFTACLYICYDLFRPDVVLEHAWRNGLQDYAMPFMIQTMRELTDKVNALEMANNERSEKEVEKEKQGSLIMLTKPVDAKMLGQPLMIGYTGGFQAPGFTQ